VIESAAALRLGLSLSNEVPIAETVGLARLAEELGLSEVWLPESGHGRGMFTVASAIAQATRRVGLGVGIVNPFWRHPSVIAMEAATLDEVSGGRVMLGLGAALWTLRAFGELDARGERPLSAMIEAIQIVRAMLRGERGIDGAIFAARTDAQLDFRRTRSSVPIYVGAVNARMLHAAGQYADGVELGALVSPGYVRWAWQHIAAGATSAGRDAAQLDLASNVLVSVARSKSAAREAVKQVLAYYMCRVETVVLSTSGADAEHVARVRSAGPVEGVRLIDDTLIDTFAAAGEPADVIQRLREYANAGLRGLLAWHVLGPEPREGLRLLATEVAPHVV
jgi:5,10-methylenetetrahydromethanopterin reductase